MKSHKWTLVVFKLLTGAALAGWGQARARAQAPVITQQPTNAMVYAGGTAVFSVGATGAAPLTHVWQFNGHNESNLFTTIAGNGFPMGGSAKGDGGPATAALLSEPLAIEADAAGNLFIADMGDCRVRKVDTNGAITTVAGTGVGGFSGDGGEATNAALNGPQGVAVGADGTVYVADSMNHRIRRVDTNGIITTIAGIGPNGALNGAFSGDEGPATNAALNQPAGLAFDLTGNLLIADQYNHRIRKITGDGVIHTIAGSTNTASGAGGYATNARINLPGNICVDAAGNLYIADYLGNAVEKVDASGIITFLQVSGGPNGVAVDGAGNLFVSAADGNVLVKIAPGGTAQRCAGLGIVHPIGAQSPDSFADLTALSFPSGLAFTPQGELLVADALNNRIRKLAPIGSTLRVPVPGKPVPGPFDVVVSNPYGSVTSSVAVITIAPPPPAVTNTAGPGYTLAFLQYTVAAGSNYLLQVTSDLTPPVAWSDVAVKPAGGATNNNWSYVATNYFVYPNRYYQLLPAP